MSDSDPKREAAMSTTAILTAKEEVIEMLRRLPDNATFEEIRHDLFVLEKMKLAKEAIRNGEVYTQEEVEERLKQWLTDD